VSSDVTGLVLLGLGLAALASPQPAAVRLRRLWPRPRARLDRGSLDRHIAPALAGITVGLLLGGVVGVAAGVLSWAGVRRVVRHLEPAAYRRLRETRLAALPLTVDLLAVCLRAGHPVVHALELVAAALPGPLAADLAHVAALQRLGAAPLAAWSQHDGDPALAPLARAVTASADSGSRLAAAFERLAGERRNAIAAQAESRARTAGVLAMAPLGLCFLPAFFCLGIVPLVLSIAKSVLGLGLG
jgi:Flp pilus assembly protein TadB